MYDEKRYLEFIKEAQDVSDNIGIKSMIQITIPI
jgi:hypothetical protein